MILLMKKDYQGCKAGDRVTFEDKAEGLALVDNGFGDEVRFDAEKDEYVPVRRVSVTVTDGIKANDA